MRPLLVPVPVALLCLTSMAALAACRGGNEPADATTSTTHAHAPIVRACPLGVPDTRVAIDEPEGRVTLTFVTVPERVPTLRGRVAEQAAQNGPEKHEGRGHDGMHGAAHGHGLRLWDMPPVRAVVEDTRDGARLHVIPLAATDLDAVRAKMRERVRALDDKDCP